MRKILSIAAAALLVSWPGSTATGQDVASAGRGRGPRFLLPAPAGTAPIEIDAGGSAVLRRPVSLDFAHPTVGTLLESIERQAGVKFAFNVARLRLDRPVELQARKITVAAALTAILLDTGLDVLLRSGNHVVLMERTPRPLLPTGSIVGRLTDAKSSLGVPGVEVFLEGTRWRTATDSTGRYRLADVDTGRYMLTLRRLGYAKQSRPVTVREGKTDTVDVVMGPVATRLNELVSTATGPRRRIDIANDVTTINADSVMRVVPVRSLTDLLETRVPGLTVQHTSGAPGDPSRLRLRGIASLLRNNDPIVIVDGIRVYAEQSAVRSANLAKRPGFNGAGGGIGDTSYLSGYTSATPSPLDYIDPNAVETIEVLKGPSAATLYGQDAANGVIVITTKKGHAGPARWTASMERGRTQMEGDYPELFLRWGHTLVDNHPVQCPATGLAPLNFSSHPACQGDSLISFQLLNDPALTVLDRGHRTVASLGVSGGTAALTYAVTGSYTDELGLMKLPGYEADRYQTSFGIVPPDWMRRPQHLTQWGATSQIAARLGTKADLSLSASLSRIEQQKSSLQDQLGTLMSTYLDRTSGTYYSLMAPEKFGGYNYGVIGTPLTSYYERATDHATQFTNGVNVTYRPQSWLTLTADAGLNVDQRTDQLYSPRGPVGAASISTDTTGFVNDGQGTSVVSTVNLRANALRPLGRGFQFRFALGANYTGTTTNDVATGTMNLAPGSSLQGSVINFVRRAETSDATFGWYVEPSVGNSKFNFSSGLRLDGGGVYGSGVSGLQLPKFPKLGGSYLLSDEPWFPFKAWVSSLRLRASYGKASRQPGPTDRLRLYGAPTQIFAEGQFVTGVGLQTLGNTEVRPEHSTEFESGIDADLLDSRLTVSVTGYRKTTDDALLSFPVATSVYGDNVNIVKNIGVTRNTGLELMAGAQLVRSGPVTWTMQLGLHQNRNVVVSLGPGVAPFYTTGGAVGSGERIAAGYPLFGRWSRPILGYADANGNGVLEPQEIQVGDTAVFAGAIEPHYEANLATTLTLWHGALTVNAALQYQRGLAQRNEVAQRLSPFSRGQQDPAASLAEQLATADLEGASLPILQTDYNWIQTVNTTRFQSVSVMYAVPATVARRLGAQTLSVAVQGENLGLWTNYRGLDPNVNAFGTGNNVTDTGVLPQPRTWQVRVHASF